VAIPGTLPGGGFWAFSEQTGAYRVTFNHIFLSDMSNYGAMNEVYREYFPANPPARYCIRADLVKPEFLVEIASIAHVER
jgi:aminoacrylate peracid reductase